MHDAAVEQQNRDAALEEPEAAEVGLREVKAAVMQQSQSSPADLHVKDARTF